MIVPVCTLALLCRYIVSFCTADCTGKHAGCIRICCWQ